jgi:Uma2 family endonuclease
MSLIAEQKRKYTFEEYIALEEAEGIRYEYWDGEVVAMAGATKRHNTIVQNTTFALRTIGRKKRCRTYSENVRQKLKYGDRYVYPDVIFTCSPDDINDDLGLYVNNPCMLIEVLSNSTADSDDHKKRLQYFKLPSLHYYLLVSQESYEVIVYERAVDFWKHRVYEGADTEIPLPLIELTLSMAAIYEDVTIEVQEEE